MNEQIQEQLSALMDGELARDQTRFLLKRLCADADLPLRWSRYHVVRQTLRRQEVAVLSPAFAHAVMARLEAEPAARARGAAPWLRWSAGGAIAASVAVAALVATRPPATDEAAAVAARGSAASGPAIAAAPAAASVPAPGEFHPPLLAPDVPVAPASFGTEYEYVQPLTVDPRLQSYMLRHYQAIGGSGQSGFVPYVLLAPAQSPQSSSSAPVPQNR